MYTATSGGKVLERILMLKFCYPTTKMNYHGLSVSHWYVDKLMKEIRLTLKGTYSADNTPIFSEEATKIIWIC